VTRLGPLRPAPAYADESRTDRAERIAARMSWALNRHRRAVAVVLAGAAVALAISALSPRPAATVAAVAASRDLTPGTVLTAADVHAVALPPADVPAGALRTAADAVGRTTSGAVRRGEPLTDVRLTGGPLQPPAPGLVAVPVRLIDPDAVRLLQAGQHVDVLAASTSTDTAATDPAALVASDVAVVAVPAPTQGAAASALDGEGALVVLATTPLQARQLAQAAVSARLSVVVVG
jgi:pilus assembly protein CpaB